MNLRSHTIPELWAALSESYRLYELDTGSSGGDDVLCGSDQTEIAHDVMFYHGLDEWPTDWTITQIAPDTLAGIDFSMPISLGELRGFPGWQDPGQTGDENNLIDDTPCKISPCGEVLIDGDVFCSAPFSYPLSETERLWYDWIARHAPKAKTHRIG